MTAPGHIDFRSDDPNAWQEDAVTVALREAARDRRPGIRPLMDERTIPDFLAWCEARDRLDASLSQMSREHAEGRIGDVSVKGELV